MLKRKMPAIHPGEILREDVLPNLQMSRAEMARRLGISRQAFNKVLREEAGISPELAVRLGKLLGNGPRLWINLQRTYDLWQAERNVDVSNIETIEQPEAA